MFLRNADVSIHSFYPINSIHIDSYVILLLQTSVRK